MRRVIRLLIALISIIVCVSLIIFLFKDKIFGTQKNSLLIKQTTNGLVEGIELTTSLDQKYYAFYGIPFAAAPITGIDPYTGERVDRRFKAPEPFKYNWTGILKADEMKPLCQSTENLPSDYSKYNYSEDCLFVNIFIPANGAEKKTVLVFIHGGGLDGGSSLGSDLGPDFFLTQDNIVVHLKYRVQIFGFLNLGFGDFTGNMALKDQQMGLKWIYENIENFSGKKDEILLIGASAGAVSTHLHMLNQQSRKYFKRAFLSSGSVSQLWFRKKNYLKEVQECLQINKMSGDLVEYLKTANVSELSNCNYIHWALTIESSNVPGAFISNTPDEIYKSDKAPIMDAMFSFGSQEPVQFFSELLTWGEPLIPEIRIESNRTILFEDFSEFFSPGKLKEATEKLRKAYFPDTTNIDAIRQGNLDYFSDLAVRANVLKSVAHQADANNNNNLDPSQHKNTFLFRISTHTNLNAAETSSHQIYTGSAHSDDLCYMFYCHYLDQFNVIEEHLQRKDEVYEMIIRRVKMITNFARFGDPSIEGDTPFKSCKSSNEIFCQEISNAPMSHVTTNIKEQLHYDTWQDVKEIYTKWMQPRY